MRRALWAILSALGYFTVLPAGAASAGPAPDAYALSYLPLVGALIGALAGVSAWGLSYFVPHPLVVAVAFALPILLTGAIHIDGFLDSCDAVIASVSPQRRLEIFKDPRHGTFAVAGMAVLSVAWVAALLPVDAWQYPALLALSGGASRLGAVGNAFVFPYARAGELTTQFESRPSPSVLIVSAVLLAVLAVYVWKWAWLICLIVMILQLTAASRIAKRLGGGLVGDVYGFLIVTAEVVILAAVAGRG